MGGGCIEISHRTRGWSPICAGILPVEHGGHHADLDPTPAVLNYQERRAGSIAHLTVFSFVP
jgi:hypothetical protein